MEDPEDLDEFIVLEGDFVELLGDVGEADLLKELVVPDVSLYLKFLLLVGFDLADLVRVVFNKRDLFEDAVYFRVVEVLLLILGEDLELLELLELFEADLLDF